MTKSSSHKNNLSDQELVNCFKETGEKSCVGELFIRYKHLVYGVCMKYLADEDESQDVQMQVFEKYCCSEVILLCFVIISFLL